MIAVAFPSPDVILAGAVTAAVVSLWLMLPLSRERRAAGWLGGLLGVAALAGVALKDRLGGLDDVPTGILRQKPPLDIAIRGGLAWFVVLTAAAAVLWLLLPRVLKRRTAYWLLGLLGGAALAGLGLVGPPSLPAPRVILAAAVTAVAGSLWLLLPRGIDRRLDRWFGILLGVAALVGFIVNCQRLGGLGEEAVFLTVSLVAVVSGAATVLTRSPVYSAIWFALALAGVAGVLLVLGAQFLGVATIVVYAGAILVMFLFVLMLAQPAGLAPYDRVSNEPFLSAVTAAVLLGLLTMAIRELPGPAAEPAASVSTAAETSVSPAAETSDPLAENHVARLGAELFGRHLVSVEVAGVLLLVALIGSIAVVSRSESAGLEDAR